VSWPTVPTSCARWRTIDAMGFFTLVGEPLAFRSEHARGKRFARSRTASVRGAPGFCDRCVSLIALTPMGEHVQRAPTCSQLAWYCTGALVRHQTRAQRFSKPQNLCRSRMERLEVAGRSWPPNLATAGRSGTHLSWTLSLFAVSSALSRWRWRCRLQRDLL